MYFHRRHSTPIIQSMQCRWRCQPPLATFKVDRPERNEDPKLGIFEFVLALVIVTSVAKVAERRFSKPRRDESLQSGTEEVLRIRDQVADLSGRLERLEEERDFYKDLLEPDVARRELPPPEPRD